MSHDQGRSPELPLPGAMASMRRLLALCYRSEPRLMVQSLLVQFASALPRPLLVLSLATLASGVVDRHPGRVSTAVGATALFVCLTWLLAVAAERVGRRFRDRVAISIEGHIARLQASIGTIEHHERPEHLNSLTVLRQKVFMLDHLYTSFVTITMWLVQLGLVAALLATVDPLLSLLLVFAAPAVLASVARPKVERRAEETSAPYRRLCDHLFTLATDASAAKDVRLAGLGDRLTADRAAAWTTWYRPIVYARAMSSVWNALAWAVFGVGYGLAVFYVVQVARAPLHDVVLVLSAGVQMSDYLSAVVAEAGLLRGVFLDSARRLAWLEDYSHTVAAPGHLSAPRRIRDGITLRDVGFVYPKCSEPVLVNANLHVPPGTVLAVVGENGAGKSTLVKLLAKLYSPTSGQIFVDGVPLHRIATGEWRRRMAGAFQDFARFEFTARTTIGLGELDAAQDAPSVDAAIVRGGAEHVISQLPLGLDTQLGGRWPEGVEVSFGEWQKMALARGFMRDDALLVVLDEPTAALDAEAEHALFESFAAMSRAGSTRGRITVLVSHRFSTVRDADLIVVLDGHRIAEVGDHATLLRNNGRYARLYRAQERGYQT